MPPTQQPSVVHTGITVRSLEASLAFWAGALGAEIERRFHLGGEFAAEVVGVAGAEIDAAVIDLNGYAIELLQYTRPEGARHHRPASNEVGSWHLALGVNDLDATVQACSSYGWHTLGEPQRMPDGPRAGTRFTYLRDADGSTIELIESP
ncbi:VOC family protein [Brachybacterium sp. MASK1Z-5]|uniref:VOC family protein n=1 Tax=Brachybacterium halotolerans TaxID=2795215 RepID=A0ABS1BE82_9MICO|nr:VOC family protein [Brachybacterium halotolerans]MBK0332956.1 VOC family protein [Brachybacterium halotolerans]